MSGCDGAIAGALQHEAARAVGILGEARGRTPLSKEGGLLVAGDASDGDSVQARDRAYFSVDFGGGPHCGQHRRGDLEEIEKVAIPTAGMKIEKHGAGGVAGVRDVDAVAG